MDDKRHIDRIDHLVYTVAELETGIDEMEKIFGVRPAKGGNHPKFGTHNAILSLGKFSYLEILAPDPNLKSPKRGRWLNNYFKNKSRLTTWAIQTQKISELANYAEENGLTLGNIEFGERKKSDGHLLTWKLTDPYVIQLDGVIPFLIDWGNTKHPTVDAPKAGELMALKIEHPSPILVGKYLKLLDMDIEISKADQARMTAQIKTQSGIINIG